MMLNCLVIDDEPAARKLLEEYISETDFLHLIASVENPLKAIGLLAAQDIDLVFLDINMPRMSGLDFLKNTANMPMVILTTAYTQYALEGFELNVVDYLVKPFSLERFIKAVQKAMELKKLQQAGSSSPHDEPDHFFVKCEGKIEKVLYDDLIYAEGMTNYITLYTTKNKLVVYLTLKNILESLPADRFVQVHKSYIVNTGHIKTIDGNALHLGAAKIHIGPGYYDNAMDMILKGKIIKR